MQVYWGSEGRPTEGPFREPAFSSISSTNNKHSCEKSSCGCWRLGLCLHQGWPRGDHTWKQTLSSENARVCWTQALCPGNIPDGLWPRGAHPARPGHREGGMTTGSLMLGWRRCRCKTGTCSPGVRHSRGGGFLRRRLESDHLCWSSSNTHKPNRERQRPAWRTRGEHAA